MLYVNPISGNDAAAGNQAAPLKSLTRALRGVSPGTVIRLAAGTYDGANGEAFPLIVPPGVTVSGDETSQGRSIAIAGSGRYNSPTFGGQSVAVLLQGDAQLRGVTVTNRASGGTGVWIESASPIVSHCSFVNCGREGIFVSGTSKPLLANNLFSDNRLGGITLARNAKGEVNRNRCDRNGYGLSINDRAAPLVSENQILENRVGLIVAQEAQPVLRRNRIELNREGGLILRDRAAPDFGQAQDPASNVLQANGLFDIQNQTPFVLVSSGNQLNPSRIEGRVKIVISEVPATQPSPGTASFPDVVGHWAEPFIAAMASKGIISGFPDGSFRPEESLTRAQYAAIIAKAFQQPARKAAIRFLDVTSTFWAYNAIAQAQRMGFIAGFPDRSFRPQQNLTRTQAILALVSGLGLPGGNPNALRIYRDRALIPSYATLAIAAATERRLLVSQPQTDTLEPLRDITRAEATAMIYQALVIAGQANAIASDLIIDPPLTNPSFADLEDHWAADFIRGLGRQRLIAGFADGTFRPNLPMTRAQYAALLVKAFNPPPKRPERDFSDVPANFWAAAAIQQAYRSGFLSGFPDGTFAPDEAILRSQALVALVQGLGLSATDASVLERYVDWQQIPSYAKVAAIAATQHRLVIATPPGTHLRPLSATTRAEASAMTYQGLVQQGRLAALLSPHIVLV